MKVNFHAAIVWFLLECLRVSAISPPLPFNPTPIWYIYDLSGKKTNKTARKSQSVSFSPVQKHKHEPDSAA